MPWEAPGDALGGLGDALECLGDALGGLGDTQEGLGDASGGPSWENLLERLPWQARQGRRDVGGPRALKSIHLYIRMFSYRGSGGFAPCAPRWTAFRCSFALLAVDQLKKMRSAGCVALWLRFLA